MRRMLAVAGSPKAGGSTQAQGEGAWFTIATTAILAMFVAARWFAGPGKPAVWSVQALALCLVVAAAAGRALLGFRGRAPTGDPSWSAPAIWAAIAAAAVLPYSHSLSIGFLSDDFGLAAAAREAGGPIDVLCSTPLRGFYRPLAMLVWYGGGRLWGGAPLGFHILSVLLHTASALLVFALGRRLMGGAYGASIAAILFAVHPLHVESVSWPAAFPDLLCTVFCLGSLLALDVHLRSGPGRVRAPLLAAALGLFLLAMVCKEGACALPAVVLLGALLEPEPALRRRLFARAGGYAVLLVAFVAWRTAVLGGLGGYRVPLHFWNTAFPSTPLLMLTDFAFPLHDELLTAAGAWPWWIATLAMAAAASWSMHGLDRVPARRLWYWIGFLFIMATPTWVVRWQLSATLDSARLAYLPTVGLAWLFGDLCAGRGRGWRCSGAAAAAVIAGAVALTVLYVLPWRQAGRLAEEAVVAGVRFIEELPASEEPPTVYVRGVPQSRLGVPVLANCYPQAVALASDRRADVRIVSDHPGSGGIHPEVMRAWVLREGEHLVVFDAAEREMRVVAPRREAEP